MTAYLLLSFNDPLKLGYGLLQRTHTALVLGPVLARRVAFQLGKLLLSLGEKNSRVVIIGFRIELFYTHGDLWACWVPNVELSYLTHIIG